MAIEQINGRWHSHKTAKEQKGILADLYKDLKPEEREAVDQIIKDYGTKGESQLLEVAYENEWDPSTGPPIPIRQWVNDDYYLGETSKTLYPTLKEDVIEIFEGGYSEIILTGCIDQNALVQCSDGALPRLKDLISKKTNVLAIDETQGVVHAQSEIGTDSGIKEVLELTLANGMKVNLTPDHKVLTTRGWVRTDALDPGSDRILRPRFIPYISQGRVLKDEEIKLLAYWTTDGSSSNTRARYCDGNIETGREVVTCLRACGFDATSEPYAKNGAWEICVKNFATNGFRAWLAQYELLGVGTKSKIIPTVVCKAPLNQIALFINRVWAAEGTVYCSDKSPPRFKLAMSSEIFIRQMQLLLLRFGIQSTLHINKAYRNETLCTAWVIDIAGVNNLKCFLDNIGPIFCKEKKSSEILKYINTHEANTNVDVVPLTWKDAHTLLQTKRIKIKPQWHKLNRKDIRYLSRSMFDRLCEDYKDEPEIKLLKNRYPETISYEKIKSIIPNGKIAVADISVPSLTRFTANGISVHNSTRWGKDYLASTCIVRILYELLCLKNPQRALGLGAGERINIIPISHTKEAAKKVVFGTIASKLNLAAFFRGRFEETLDEIRFKDKNIYISGGASGDQAALGQVVFVALLDEANFLGHGKATTGSASGEHYDRAQMIYEALARRIKNQFAKSGVKGMIFCLSSKKSTYDFTERRIKESIEDPCVFVRDRCFSGDTKIPLLNGKTVTIKELAQTYKDSEERFWVYSYDTKSNLIVPGKAHHPRLTAMQQKLLKITLDNGESIKVTGNHPFLMRDNTYKNAEDLIIGDSLMPLYRKLSEKVNYYNHKVTSIEDGGVEDVYDLSVEGFENFGLESGVFVHNCTWLVRPENFIDQKWYTVVVSPKGGRSKVLPYGEEAEPSAISFKFPEVFLKEFLRDPDGATRDLAGICTDATNPFIVDRQSIDDMMRPGRLHPFGSHEWETDKPLEFKWNKVITVNARNESVPICCPGAQRHAHLDLSKNLCNTGLCVGHLSGMTEVMRTDEFGKKKIEDAPIVHIDMVLEIRPPNGGEIDHEQVRNLLLEIKKAGFPLRSVSMDQWCHTPNAQLLRKMGFKVDDNPLSVVRTLIPYISARNILYERRIESPVYPNLKEELYALELNKECTKVQKPRTSLKDLADAWAGVCFYLSEHATGGKSVMPTKGITESAFGIMRPDGPTYVGNGDFVWPDEQQPLPNNPASDGTGLPSWIII